jgi:hypothetical protein
MPTDWLSPIGTRECHGSRITLYLIRHEHNEIELLGKLGKLAKMDAELLLAFTQFSTALVVAAEEIENAVDDEESIFSTSEELCKGTERLVLVFAIGSAMDDDVVVGHVGVDWKTSALAIVTQGINVLSKRSAI